MTNQKDNGQNGNEDENKATGTKKTPRRRTRKASDNGAKKPAAANNQQDNKAPETPKQASPAQEPQADAAEPGNDNAASDFKIAGLGGGAGQDKGSSNDNGAGKAAPRNNRRRGSSALGRVFQAAAVGTIGAVTLVGKTIGFIGPKRIFAAAVFGPIVLGVGSAVLENENFEDVRTLRTVNNAVNRTMDWYQWEWDMVQGAFNAVTSPFRAISGALETNPVTDTVLLCHQAPSALATSEEQRQVLNDKIIAATDRGSYLYGQIYGNSDFEAIEVWRDGGYPRITLDIRPMLNNQPASFSVQDMGSQARHQCQDGYVAVRYPQIGRSHAPN